jgi:hypothetical protein
LENYKKKARDFFGNTLKQPEIRKTLLSLLVLVDEIMKADYIVVTSNQPNFSKIRARVLKELVHVFIRLNSL